MNPKAFQKHAKIMGVLFFTYDKAYQIKFPSNAQACF